jgi:protein-tyrosine phosphatase
MAEPATSRPPTRVLLVCLGNICRSPTAAAALREAADAAGLGESIAVDSAGTGDRQLGKPPNPQMVAAAAQAGLSLSGRARQVGAEDFSRFDLVLAMDRQNLADLRALAPTDADRDKVELFLTAAGEPDGEIADPYQGRPEEFADVVRTTRRGAHGLVRRLGSGKAGA